MVSTNLIHPKVGQLEYLMFHTSHMYTQFTSCRITCIVAESCHEEHGQRKDDTQSKSGPFMFKKRDACRQPSNDKTNVRPGKPGKP